MRPVLRQVIFPVGVKPVISLLHTATPSCCFLAMLNPRLNGWGLVMSAWYCAYVVHRAGKA
jgi:hypothetical protein